MKKLLIILFTITTQLCIGQSADDYFKQAEKAYENKDYKAALKAIQKTIELDQSRAEYFLIEAEAHTQLKHFQEAYDTYCKGIAYFPDSSYMYSERGVYMMKIARFELAINDFDEAIKIAEYDSLKYGYINNRAAAKMNIRDFESAYQDLLLSYQFDSTHIGTLTNLGAVCDEIGKGEETLKYLLKAIEVDSTFYPAYGNIGFKYQEMGEYEKSIKYYNKVLEMQPDEPLGYSNRSYSKLKLGDLKGAMEDIQKSIKMYPQNSYAYRNRALIYIEKGKTKKACEDLQIALDKGFTKMYGDEVLKLQEKHCK